jgi:hypothetical protein
MGFPHMNTKQGVWELVLGTLLEAGVRFLVVGGWAREFHGLDHHADDLDLFIEFSAENWGHLQAAMQQLGIDLASFEELSQRSNPLRIRDLNPDVDLVTGIPGVSFDDGWSSAVETTFGRGLRVHVLSEAHAVLSSRGYLIRTGCRNESDRSETDIQLGDHGPQSDGDLPSTPGPS